MPGGSSPIALGLIGLAVGADNFAAAVGIGIPGGKRRLHLQVAAVFGVFEAGAPILGALLGHRLAGGIARAAGPVAGSLIAALGAWSVGVELLEVRRARAPRLERGPASTHETGQLREDQGLAKLVLTGALLGADNLVVGFALGTERESLALVALVIGLVSVLLSFAGLEVGRFVGARIAGTWASGNRASGKRRLSGDGLRGLGEIAGGLVLIVVGACIGVGLL